MHTPRRVTLLAMTARARAIVYWPEKRSISVEWNVVFNPDYLLTEGDSVVVQDNVLNEGESGKVIQNQTNGKDIKTDENHEIDNKIDLPALEPVIEHQEHVPEPSIQPPKRARRAETLPEPKPNTGRGFHTRPKPGAYKLMHKGLDPAHANAAIVNDDIDCLDSDSVDSDTEYAFIMSMGNEPGSLDEALSGPHTDEWQAAWDKEISRLDGAHTWELVEPPKGVLIIPCNEVFKEKTGPDGSIVER
jgi:hypothetical protein